MSERLMMEGKKIGLDREAQALRYRIEGLCTLIRGQLNTALIPHHEDLQISEAAAHMDELVMAQAELLSLISQIRKLEAALGR
ncbi:MAG TPA: hypothetical protein DCG53_05030 [Syntrophus sp. (in: bacteria)]|jgi:hypothetical protein|nr:hypothetical protein [Deltaproteobacteria bacterium]HAJ26598.1 hypothetical protein [Syntrophus sp. (in: bacteria)]